MKRRNIFLILLFILLKEIKGDIPCAPRFYPNKSSVCVCNSTYCDTVTREQPAAGTFIYYTSSKAGSRFKKSKGFITQTNCSDTGYEKYSQVIKLQPNKTYQSIEGFGGAVTDAAGINLMSLPTKAQQRLIDSYFSDDGIEYNMLRVPIGSSDFSTFDYTYSPQYDYNLTNFTLTSEDYNIKIPLIKKCQKAAKEKLEVVSAVWSAPLWMRTKNNSKVVAEKYYQPFANYHCKFAEIYKEHGIKIWGLSPSNEPLTELVLNVSFTEMFWTPIKMGKFIANYFGPTIRNCSVSGMKILANDDQRYSIPLLFTQLNITHPEAMEYIDGIASHFYADKVSPPAIVSYALQQYPEKFIMSTEASAGALSDIAVDLGSWDRAKQYITNILENLNYNYFAWIDWNLCLNTKGGPNWSKQFIDSLVIVDAENKEFLKQPMFYGFGHFTKFTPRGSQRIRTTTLVPVPDPDLDIQDIELLRLERFDNVAFATPRGTIVFIIHNEGPAKMIAILLGDQQMSILLEEVSITTVEIPFDGN